MTPLESPPRPEAPVASPPVPARPLDGWSPASPRSRARRWALALAVVVLLVAAAAGARTLAGPIGGVATPTPTATAPRYDARGRIAPAAQARVASLQGGTVRSVARAPGELVAARAELARLETPSGESEVLVAPFAGTVLAVPIQAGDSLMPGAQVALVGDLTELRVETTDVDEYLVGSLRIGQPIEVSVDALGGAALAGRITGITLAPQPTGSGDLHYPVYVRLDRSDAGLRPGMTARLRVRPGGG